MGLPLVHLARPRLRDDLRRGWREQALRLRLCHRTDLRAHGDQLKRQRQHQQPTSWTPESDKDANQFFSYFISSQKQHQSQLDEKLRNQPEIIKGIWTICTGLLPTHCCSNGGPEKPPSVDVFLPAACSKVLKCLFLFFLG